MSIWFHGTHKRRTFRSICKNGLAAYSYLTPYLDTAISMGGKFIIAVWYKEDPTKYWQYRDPEIIPPSRFLYAKRFWQRIIFHNLEQEEIKRRDQLLSSPNAKICESCNGHGELGVKTNSNYIKMSGASFKRGTWRKCKICSDCHGRGIVDDGYEDN